MTPDAGPGRGPQAPDAGPASGPWPPKAGLGRTPHAPDAGLEDPDGGWVAAERRRVEGLILRGTQRDWLRYLAEVTVLVSAVAAHGADRGARAAALRAAETVLDHHRMLIGLPGPAYERVASGRAELIRAVAALRDQPADEKRVAA